MKFPFSLFRKKQPQTAVHPDIENINPVQEEMIRGVLDLSNMKVTDILTPRVDIIAIPAESKLKEIIPLAADDGHSRIPVYEGTVDNIIGILYTKDLIRILAEKKPFNLKEIIHKPLFVPETMELDGLLRLFKKRRHHLAIVVDEYGGISGLVTLENVLEEIVGEINDEYDDPEKARIIKKSRNEYEADARVPIHDFNARTGLHLPDERFGTIGGLVLDIFGRIPERGEESRNGRYVFRIKEIRGTRLQRVVITVMKAAS
jgi:CBS domain containing-hemolysin-like protein